MPSLRDPITLCMLLSVLAFLTYAILRAVRSVERVFSKNRQGLDNYGSSPELSDLVHRKRQALAILKEGELDLDTGKVDEAEFNANQGAASARAIEIMKEIDGLRAKEQFGEQVEAESAGQR